MVDGGSLSGHFGYPSVIFKLVGVDNMYSAGTTSRILERVKQTPAVMAQIPDRRTGMSANDDGDDETFSTGWS